VVISLPSEAKIAIQYLALSNGVTIKDVISKFIADGLMQRIGGDSELEKEINRLVEFKTVIKKED